MGGTTVLLKFSVGAGNWGSDCGTLMSALEVLKTDLILNAGRLELSSMCPHFHFTNFLPLRFSKKWLWSVNEMVSPTFIQQYFSTKFSEVEFSIQTKIYQKCRLKKRNQSRKNSISFLPWCDMFYFVQEWLRTCLEHTTAQHVVIGYVDKVINCCPRIPFHHRPRKGYLEFWSDFHQTDNTGKFDGLTFHSDMLRRKKEN